MSSTYHNADALVNKVELPIGSLDVQPVEREFSSLHQLSSERFGANTYLDTLFGRTYARDSVGRITAAQRTIGNKAREFYYDSAGRSTGYADVTYGPSLCVVGPNGGCGGSPGSGSSTGGPQYSYDKVGNRLDDGAATGTANRLLQISGYTYQYDADGNVTRRTGGGVDQYLYWNSINQLDSIWSSNVGMVRFSYDGRGRRIRKQGPTYAWNYHYTGEQLYTETKDDGTVMRTYKYYPGIDNPASVTNWDRTYHFVSDASGNITGAIDESNGAIANQYTYAPYGQLESVGQAFDNPVRFKGRYHDNELNLYENRARYYDPIAGRFLSEDPIGLEGGINQYVFAGNDPINFSDPSGLCVIDPSEATLTIWTYYDEEGIKRVGTSLPAICTQGRKFESGESDNFGKRPTGVPFGGGDGGGGSGGGWTIPTLRPGVAQCGLDVLIASAGLAGDIVTAGFGRTAFGAARLALRYSAAADRAARRNLAYHEGLALNVMYAHQSAARQLTVYTGASWAGTDATSGLSEAVALGARGALSFIPFVGAGLDFYEAGRTCSKIDWSN